MTALAGSASVTLSGLLKQPLKMALPSEKQNKYEFLQCKTQEKQLHRYHFLKKMWVLIVFQNLTSYCLVNDFDWLVKKGNHWCSKVSDTICTKCKSITICTSGNSLLSIHLRMVSSKAKLILHIYCIHLLCLSHNLSYANRHPVTWEKCLIRTHRVECHKFLPVLFLINKGNKRHKEKGQGCAIKIWKWIWKSWEGAKQCWKKFSEIQ